MYKHATASDELLIQLREQAIQNLNENVFNWIFFSDFSLIIDVNIVSIFQIITQQKVIAQASQALNICRATEEFSGSTEQAEGERVLLIASQPFSMLYLIQLSLLVKLIHLVTF